MWYRSYRSNPFLTLPHFSSEKRRNVKSLLPQKLLPLHWFSSSFLTLDGWHYTTYMDTASKSLIAVFSASKYKLIQVYPFIANAKWSPTNQFFASGAYTETKSFVTPIAPIRHISVHDSVWVFAASRVFMKLKFRGKGYYLYKSKRNSLSFRFGFSHRVYRYPGLVAYKMVSKTEIFLWGRFLPFVWNFAWTIKKIRPHNQYTGKGIRFLRQITYRKVGKIGSYR